ncbi:substrate-binding domain-containing protein, partial [Acinetobacter nosocomialis]|uniref:substrate-binding domain-containing protein n=2 Tax=Moraxellaceae TaxID=468 RepID=UPI0030FA7AF6
DNYLAGWDSFQLTTFSQPSKQMVDQAIQILLEQIENENSLPKHIVVEGELIVRQSSKLPKVVFDYK